MEGRLSRKTNRAALFLEEKLTYIHENPDESGFVSLAEDYLYSSVRNYSGEQGVFEVEL